ncbi:MAG TPA: hypothetical protein PKY59_12200 [Pyrinomonadaceae bacterium]|nr:hypothetical protein [Pyrinomonadaceae bacterium]
MSEVEVEIADKSPVDIEPVGETLSDIEEWQVILLKNIALHNGCYSLVQRAGFQVVIGREIDRKITINLYQYFEKLGQELADKYLNDRNAAIDAVFTNRLLIQMLKDSDSSDEKRRKSFLYGYAQSISARLEESSKENISTDNNETALVFMGNKEKDNRQWMQENLNVTKNPMNVTVDSTALEQGRLTGNKIALTNKTLK